jgi:hypothetical protein
LFLPCGTFSSFRVRVSLPFFCVLVSRESLVAFFV